MFIDGVLQSGTVAAKCWHDVSYSLLNVVYFLPLKLTKKRLGCGSTQNVERKLFDIWNRQSNLWTGVSARIAAMVLEGKLFSIFQDIPSPSSNLKKSRPSPLIFLSSNFSDRITRYSRSFQFHLASVQSFNFLIHPIHIHKYQDGTNCKTLSMRLPQAELGGRNENSVEVCRSHFKRDGNAGVWGAWGAHLRIFLYYGYMPIW